MSVVSNSFSLNDYLNVIISEILYSNLNLLFNCRYMLTSVCVCVRACVRVVVPAVFVVGCVSLGVNLAAYRVSHDNNVFRKAAANCGVPHPLLLFR